MQISEKKTTCELLGNKYDETKSLKLFLDYLEKSYYTSNGIYKGLNHNPNMSQTFHFTNFNFQHLQWYKRNTPLNPTCAN